MADTKPEPFMEFALFQTQQLRLRVIISPKEVCADVTKTAIIVSILLSPFLATLL